MENQYNRNGGLTLVPMPDFIGTANEIKGIIENMGGTADETRYSTSVDIATPVYGERASGEPYVKLAKEHVGGHDCVVLTSGPGTPTMLIQLCLTLSYLVGRRARRIAIISGYLPLTRSDKDEGEKELAIIATIIHLLESAAYGKLDRIIAADLHAVQEVGIGSKPGLITEVSLARRVLRQAIGNIKKADESAKISILFPDDGALKRSELAVQSVGKEFGMTIPVACGQKRRQSSRASDFFGAYGDRESLRDAYVIGFDDEIAGGGTSSNTAKAAKELGARAYHATVIHGVLCGEASNLLADPGCGIDRIIITDTIPVAPRRELERLRQSGRLVVIPWIDEMAEIVYRHHWDESIRSMR